MGRVFYGIVSSLRFEKNTLTNPAISPLFEYRNTLERDALERRDVFHQTLVDFEANHPGTYRSDYFTSFVASEYYEAARDLTMYVHNRDIQSVVFMDRAARAGYIGLLHCWRACYPDKERPSVHFMNWAGIQSAEDAYPKSTERAIKHLTKAKLDYRSHLSPRPESVVAMDFRETFRDLIAKGDAPLLIVDSCLHSGESVQPAVQRLQRNGCTNIRLAIANGSDMEDNSLVKADVVFRNDLMNVCHIYGRKDTLVAKTFDRVVSSPNEGSECRKGRNLRMVAREIIRTGLRLDGLLE